MATAPQPLARSPIGGQVSLPPFFQPATFRDRGVSVPFTLPRLAQARVRKDSRDKLEALVPGFAEGKGIYVIGWAGVPSVVSMTVHDLMLHETIEREPNVTPHSVRIAALKAQSSGLAGTDAATVAKRELEIAEYEKVVAGFSLIAEAARIFAGTTDFRWNDFISASSRDRVREILGRIAKPLEQTPSEVYDALAAWGDMVASLGLPQQHHRARCRRLVDGLGPLADGLRDWAYGDRDEAAPLARSIAASADYTRGIAESAIATVDSLYGRMGHILPNWSQVQAEIQKHIERVHWILDGWDFLQALWRRAIKEGVREQRSAIGEMYRILPIIPVEAVPAEAANPQVNLVIDHARMVRVLRDWRTGRLDMELIERLERMKADPT